MYHLPILRIYPREVCFIAGAEFIPLEGHLLVIDHALYGLQTSVACRHDHLADDLRDMGYFQCKADHDYGARTVTRIMNKFWYMLTTFCALAPISNVSLRLSPRYITSS
jgi:hypothetical protein